ncbi:MAG TPA: amino acid permease, partial [Vicinamibacteria bacterium]|nr:amino acid permease [Vicinamibacteria bacterium]
IIGANGVLNRVSEDGVMPDWFREPHRKYGTTYRVINLLVLLQVVSIVGSRGNTYTLGEAYAFGVIWSFAFKGLAMVVLRFKDRSHREWKVPFNLEIGGTALPLGLGTVTVVLFALASVNLITKEIATISGIGFTLVFFGLFLLSEKVNERRGEVHVETDQFRLETQEVISNETVAVRPGCTICLVRDYNTLEHVRKALELTHTGKRDLVMMTVRILTGADAGYEGLAERQVFARYEQLLFSKVVSLAEKFGKTVHLLVVPSSNIFDAIARTAVQLDASGIVAGASSTMTPQEQARRLGEAWERLPVKPRRQVSFRVIHPDGRIEDFSMGAHAPALTDDDINLIHQLWLDAARDTSVGEVHHRDLVRVALKHLERELQGPGRDQILTELRRLYDDPGAGGGKG